MIISCPSCRARYELAGDPDSLPAEGRTVRCGRCANVWQALAVDPPPEILPPEMVWGDLVAQRDRAVPEVTEPAPSGARLVDDAGDRDSLAGDEADDIQHPAERARRAAIGAGSGKRHAGAATSRRLQGFALGVMLALLGAALFYRADIVRMVPASAGVYELVGLPVNLRGLEFRDVTPRRIFEDGLPVLVIEGEIVNLHGAEVGVPALRIAVRGGAREELYAWTIEPRQSQIAGGGSMRFRTRLSAPPSQARDVQVRFAERTRQTAGVSP